MMENLYERIEELFIIKVKKLNLDKEELDYILNNFKNFNDSEYNNLSTEVKELYDEMVFHNIDVNDLENHENFSEEEYDFLKMRIDDLEKEIESYLFPEKEYCSKYLMQIKLDDGSICNHIFNELQVINRINMNDLYNEEFEVYDVSEFGKIKKLHYVGWQPNCLIELVDDDNHVIISGYGEDH